MRLIRVNKTDHRIEGLTELEVLRIYKALESVQNKSNILELEIMISCLKMDMDNINKKLSRKV